MAGTRTAPTVDGSPTTANATLHAIDASGDKKTLNIPLQATTTPAEIEAWVAAYQAATQASVYKVTTYEEYSGTEDADNAEALYRGSNSLGINQSYRDPAVLDALPLRLMAPVASTLQGNQDIPLVTDTVFAALITAQLAILPAGYGLVSVQYTGRRDRNQNNTKISV